jgi:hypothetical protein
MKPRYELHCDRSIDNLVDAAHKFRELCPIFAASGGGAIKIGAIGLPDGNELRLVVLLGPLNQSGRGQSLGLPSAETFRALRPGASDWHHFPIDCLDGAQIDQDGTVALADHSGANLHDVRLDVTALPRQLTDAERLALRTIVWSETGDTLVEFAYLPDLNNIPLKLAERRWQQHRQYDSTVPQLSPEVFRSTLVKCGMRRAMRRRRS